MCVVCLCLIFVSFLRIDKKGNGSKIHRWQLLLVLIHLKLQHVRRTSGPVSYRCTVKGYIIYPFEDYRSIKYEHGNWSYVFYSKLHVSASLLSAIHHLVVEF